VVGNNAFDHAGAGGELATALELYGGGGAGGRLRVSGFGFVGARVRFCWGEGATTGSERVDSP